MTFEAVDVMKGQDLEISLVSSCGKRSFINTSTHTSYHLLKSLFFSLQMKDWHFLGGRDCLLILLDLSSGFVVFSLALF